MVGGNVAYPSYYRPVCAGLTQRDTKYSQLWIIQNHQLLENPEKVTQMENMQNAYRKPSPNSGFEPTACYEAALLTTPCHRAVLKKKRKRKKGQKYKTQ